MHVLKVLSKMSSTACSHQTESRQYLGKRDREMEHEATSKVMMVKE